MADASLDHFFLIQSGFVQAGHQPPCSLFRGGTSFDKETPVPIAFDSLVAADPGNLDHSDVAETSTFPEPRTAMCWIS